MMEAQNWLALLNHNQWLAQVQETNQRTERFGLTLSEEDAELLLQEKSEILKKERRVELGESILPRLIYAFCDSSFLSQDNYLETLIRLQEIFFLYKNEMQDEVTDEELLNFMREQFEEACYGDLDYLEGTCLAIFAQAIRAGYRGYQETGGRGEYERLDIAPRWDYELYHQALSEMIQ